MIVPEPPQTFRFFLVVDSLLVDCSASGRSLPFSMFSAG